ncbi:hypothetical protein C8R47DRAFT_1067734 [Mycena vitilis]|nr:hypothetical protein C8R47DRAFT_1067734 [Mycena vitilis]
MLHRTLCALLSVLLLPPMAYASPRPTLTNAARLRAGLGPLKPRTLFNPTRVHEARQQPSGSPPAGSLQCCASVVPASDGQATAIIALLGIVVLPNAPVGIGCTPVTILGVGPASCTANLALCENPLSSESYKRPGGAYLNADRITLRRSSRAQLRPLDGLRVISREWRFGERRWAIQHSTSAGEDSWNTLQCQFHMYSRSG